MLHIIQNDPEVPPGNITDSLHIPYIVHHPYRDGFMPEPGDISSLIVLGGAMGANDDLPYPFLSNLKALIRRIVDAEIPYLGVCLGGQLLAAALGAKVVSHRWEELGMLPVALTEAGKTDPLFGGIPAQFHTFQWHHDSFDIPDGGVLLASSEACPHQAFRVGNAAWGIQFHPEVTEPIIRDWCAWDITTLSRTEELVAEFNVKAESCYAVSRQLINNFLFAMLPH